MIAGLLILTAWLALLVGFVGGSAFVAYRREGTTLIGRQFVAEVATLMVGLGYVLYGLEPTLAVLGIVR